METIVFNRVLQVRLKRMDTSISYSNANHMEKTSMIKKESFVESDNEPYEEPITHLSNSKNCDDSLRKSNVAKSQELRNYIDTASDSEILKAFTEIIHKTQNFPKPLSNTDALPDSTKSHHFEPRKRSKTDFIVINNTNDNSKSKNHSSSMDVTVKIVTDKTGRRIDFFCWKCHQKCVDNKIYCTKCPRCFHKLCLGLPIPDDVDHWQCPECLPSSEDSVFSILYKDGKVQLLQSLLTTILHRISAMPGVTPLFKPNQNDQDYSTYIVNSIYLEDIAENINKKIYTDSKGFFSDLQWLAHNIIVQNCKNQSLLATCKAFLRTARQLLQEVELCMECYCSRNVFGHCDDVCKRPHLLIWAKMKGYPFWPAKVLAISKTGMVNVAFFGDYHKNWIYAKNCFLFSNEYPLGQFPKKQKGFDKAMKEINRHISFIKSKFGSFNYALCQSVFDPFNEMKYLKEMIPTLDDVEPCKIISRQYKKTRKELNHSELQNKNKNQNVAEPEKFSEPSEAKEYERVLFEDIEDDVCIKMKSKKKRKLEEVTDSKKKHKNNHKNLPKKDLNDVYKDALKKIKQNETEDNSFAIRKVTKRVYTNTKKGKNTSFENSQNYVHKSADNSHNSSIEIGNNSQISISADISLSNEQLTENFVHVEKNNAVVTDSGKKINNGVATINTQQINEIRQQMDNIKKSNLSKTNSQIQSTIQRLKKNDGLLIKRQTLKESPTIIKNIPIINSSILIANKVCPIIRKNVSMAKNADSAEKQLPKKITKINATSKFTLTDKLPININNFCKNVSSLQKISPLKVLNADTINSNYKTNELSAKESHTNKEDSVILTPSVETNMPDNFQPILTRKQCVDKNKSIPTLIGKQLPPLLQKPLACLDPFEKSNAEDIHPPSSAGPVHELLEQSTPELVGFFKKVLLSAIVSPKFQETSPEAVILNLQRQNEKLNWEKLELTKKHDNIINSLKKNLKEKHEIAIKETKLKQWCAFCLAEAEFYCCWNISYCSVSCQTIHWQSHWSHCTRKKSDSPES